MVLKCLLKRSSDPLYIIKFCNFAESKISNYNSYLYLALPSLQLSVDTSSKRSGQVYLHMSKSTTIPLHHSSNTEMGANRFIMITIRCVLLLSTARMMSNTDVVEITQQSKGCKSLTDLSSSLCIHFCSGEAHRNEYGLK